MASAVRSWLPSRRSGARTDDTSLSLRSMLDTETRWDSLVTQHQHLYWTDEPQQPVWRVDRAHSVRRAPTWSIRGAAFCCVATVGSLVATGLGRVVHVSYDLIFAGMVLTFLFFVCAAVLIVIVSERSRPPRRDLRAAERASADEVVIPARLSPGSQIVLRYAQCQTEIVAQAGEWVSDLAAALQAELFPLACNLRLLDTLYASFEATGIVRKGEYRLRGILALLLADRERMARSEQATREFYAQKRRCLTAATLYGDVARDVRTYADTLATHSDTQVTVLSDAATDLTARLSALRELHAAA